MFVKFASGADSVQQKARLMIKIFESCDTLLRWCVCVCMREFLYDMNILEGESFLNR